MGCKLSRRSSIKRRGNSGVYQARIYIPQDLQPYFKCEEKKVSLRTKDESEAKRLFHELLAKWEALFQDLRTRRNLTADDKADAIWQHYTDTLSRDDQTRLIMPTQADIDTAHKRLVERVQKGEIIIDPEDPLAVMDASLEILTMQSARQFYAESRQHKLAALREHVAIGETALISHEVADYIDRNKLMIDPNSLDLADLAMKLIRAEIEALERTMERDRGDYSGVPKDPLVKPPTGNNRIQAKPGETILEVFEIYARENPRRISTDTLNQARRDIGTLVDYLGGNAPIQRIDKKAVREWKDLLLRLPIKATESTVFAGMKFAQIIRHNQTVGKPVISSKTVNRYISSLGAFCKWAVAHGYLDSNPTEGMFLAKEKKVTTVPFTTDQLNKLFASPLFAGCQSAKEWRHLPNPGPVKVRDHRFWVPLIMLFSGARPGEIAQLSVSDVRQEHGQWIMHITEEGEGDKSVKTSGSMRVLPIHDELIRLGFIKYHEKMKQAGQTRLFPAAKRSARGQMIADYSREFPRYLNKIGIRVKRGLSLYSFRHGVADALRRAGYLDEQFGFILGHTSGTMTGRYGIMPQGMLQQRVELINSISYPGLKLDHLI
ncbi:MULTISPECIES: DUF6538 domain-containing protein [unclassified Brucella]|uniref:DUF6538 domain-containing protein n=1 Tax=unclassified Brucella TaxID=2632610 RepID=UPI000B0E6F0A|nr:MULTISPECIES: DUF6538 domain-containing protein [unclassified Brucella]